MRPKHRCEMCELKGYSPELCKIHLQRGAARSSPSTDCNACRLLSAREMGKSVVVGASVGVAATVIGLAAVPAATIKALCGHVVACKIGASAGGGVTGAGINTFRKSRRQRMLHKKRTRRRLYLPTIF